MVSQLNPLFFIQKVAFCRGFITATGKTCETGKVNCFLAVLCEHHQTLLTLSKSWKWVPEAQLSKE